MKIVKSVLIFLIAFLICDRLFYIALINSQSFIYEEGDYFKVLGRLVKKRDYNTLILGTSRTYNGVHPVHILSHFRKKAYREAAIGKNPRYNYHFYKEYKKLAGIPKVVIYGIDYFIFGSTSHERWLSRFDSGAREVELFSGFSNLIGNKDVIDRTINSSIDFLRDNLLGETKDKVSQKILRAQAYVGLRTNYSKLVNLKPRRMLHSSYTPFPGREGVYLDMLLREMDQDGVKVMLLILPDHRGTYFTNNCKRECVMDLRNLASKYENVFLYNYNMPEVFPIDNDEFFLDGGYGIPNSHLSSSGAQYLSRKLLFKDLAPFYE